MTTVLRTSPRRFVTTPAIERLTSRALRYLQSGYSVHLRGPAGTGKTTLALHLADLLQRPMMLMFGDDDAKTSDLIGTQAGYTRKKVVDNFIHSVVKVEDQLRQSWVDSRLTLACREGFTLIYDEFNRSRPEVNNVLLSVLEEKILVLPPESNKAEYVRVSPEFRAIFTSNPEEYCGVHSTQDALMDRLITINVPEPDELTQQEILVQKTELDRQAASLIVRLVKTFWQETSQSKTSGLRACMMIATIAKQHQIEIAPSNPEFRDLCLDILLSRSPLPVEEATTLLWQILLDLGAVDEAQSILKDLIPVAPIAATVPIAAQVELPIADPLVERNAEKRVERSLETDLTPTLSMSALVEAEPQNAIALLEILEESEPEVLSPTRPETIAPLSTEPSIAELEFLTKPTSPSPLEETIAQAYIKEPSPEIASLEKMWEHSDQEMIQPVAEDHSLDYTSVPVEAEPVPAESVDPEPVVLTLEEQIYQYLLTCPKGARLSQIESDLRLQRSQVVEGVRGLAKERRLAQRDRHFFAFKSEGTV
ncbi:MAG: gas vesicle protein GvpN [Synechococcales bacterium]|nr:gas vesicle protein GvpN [Synechococcales bacterium]